jgi:AAA15 family ATPase/GTPase
MLSRLSIKNFKSIRDLEFHARRVNIFIGEPNTGKTNIIEAMALLSTGIHQPATFKEVFRFRSIADLYTDQQTSAPIIVAAPECQCLVTFKAPRFEFSFKWHQQVGQQVYYTDRAGGASQWVNLEFGIRYFKFKPNGTIGAQEFGTLRSPYADNLTSIIYTNKALRKKVADLFRSRNFNLEIKPVEMEMSLGKAIDDELYNFPYDSISETWRRIVFHMAVQEVTKDGTLLLDEPETDVPHFDTAFAQQIAADPTNQYFIVTHSPHILTTLVSKVPVKDLFVFITTMDGSYTKVKAVSGKGLAKILEDGTNVFANLEKFVEK